MAKQRTLTAAEEAARKACGGLTRREFRAKNSKFRNRPEKTSSGSYEVVAIFDGNPVPQTAPFPNMAAALSRFERLSSNPIVRSLKVIENVTIKGANGEPIGMKQVAIHSLVKTGQEFANSTVTKMYREPGGNTLLTMKSILASPRLAEALMAGKLEVASYRAEGGNAWWEKRQ